MAERSLAELVDATGLPYTEPLTVLGLTWHVTNPLAAGEITTLGALTLVTDQDLLDLPGFGPGRLAKLRAALDQAGTTTSPRGDS